MSWGRCSGCGTEDRSCARVRHHVQTCPEAIALFRSNPEALRDPEDEYRLHRSHAALEAPLPAVDRNVAPVSPRHPETAQRAAQRALPRTGSKRRLVVTAIEDRPSTAEEVGDAFGWPHQSYSATVSTLVRDGWLEDSGERRSTATGNEAIVWRLTEHARTMLEEDTRARAAI